MFCKNKKVFIEKSCKYEPLVGTIKYSNKQLEKLGVKEGDEIVFKPESEYHYYVEDELLYRMFTDNITVILDDK